MRARLYAPPRDRLRLAAEDARVFALAERLWEEAEDAGRDPIEVVVRVADGAAPGPLAERDLTWRLLETRYELSIPGLLHGAIDLPAARIDAEVSSALLDMGPALFVRTLFEAACGVLFQRRAFAVLHAGAVVGERGAVVIRGPSSAGKSTLVAACFSAGLAVLADESLMVAREDPDDLVSSLRDLTLSPEAARLAGVADTEPAFTGGEEKRRVDLFRGSSPAARRARRAATLLLGAREPGPARLVTLSGDEFVSEFKRGEIPQERLAADPDAIALDWRGRSVFRLDGASDLDGAVKIVKSHAGRPETSAPERTPVGGRARR